jgi:5'-nucleotidase
VNILKLLLTNDDGIYSEGINFLADVLNSSGHKIAIVAPDRERSAAGHSITISDPLRAKKVVLNNVPELTSYKVNGTPADCVKLGIEKLIDFEPELIISGINNGPNLGYDVLYSGTVSAAIEGWMMGYSSIAISLNVNNGYNFYSGAIFINTLIKNINKISIEEKMLLNINLPDINKEFIKGIKITTLGKSLYEDNFEERIDPMGNTYYWLTGESIKDESKNNSDIWAVYNNFISITPLKLDLTNFSQMNSLCKLKELINL